MIKVIFQPPLEEFSKIPDPLETSCYDLDMFSTLSWGIL